MEMMESQKRGRLLLIGAFLIIATLILLPMAESLLAGDKKASKDFVGNGIAILILVVAFRGGQVALKLAKGCALLFAGINALLIGIILVSRFKKIPLPEQPTVANTVPFAATLLGVIFTVWALFFSRDVRDFIRFQRERSSYK